MHLLHALDFRQAKYSNICQPGGTHPPQAGWLGAIRSHKLLEEVSHLPAWALPVPGLPVIEFRDFPEIGVLKRNKEIKSNQEIVCDF